MLNFKFGRYPGANPKHRENSQGKGKKSSGKKTWEVKFFFCLFVCLIYENN